MMMQKPPRFLSPVGYSPDKFQHRTPHSYQPYKPYPKPGDGGDFDGKRLRKSMMRKTVDYNSSVIRMLECRIWQRDYRDHHSLQPDVCFYPELLPPPGTVENPVNAVTTKFVRTATNKARCPIFCLAWTPEGRRLVTGASSGEFTLWNGLTFNFETILQAHDSPVRSMVWSHSDCWMVTGDHGGYVKYWQSNMNNVKMFQAHKEATRGISFSPMDQKFASCSDDGTVRIWDFMRCYEERMLRGHGADVKCVHWHPQKALVVSGSKDNQQPIKLWDPKTGQSIATLHAHKSTVMDLKWNQNGNWLITASRDHLLKLFDIRNMSVEVQTFRGHKKEASSVSWNPAHEGLFASGGSDGSVMFWHVGADKEVGAIDQAHDSLVWALAWHPLGHILCSGSNDHTSKFWTRNRPGDLMRDRYNLNTLPTGVLEESEINALEENIAPAIIPGMGPDDKIELLAFQSRDMSEETSIPGLDFEGISDPKPPKKVPFTKPISRKFQAQWNETIQQPPLHYEEEEDEYDEDGNWKRRLNDPIASAVSQLQELLGLFKPLQDDDGVDPSEKLIPLAEIRKPTAIFVDGKFLPIVEGSDLALAFERGTTEDELCELIGKKFEENEKTKREIYEQEREKMKSKNYKDEWGFADLDFPTSLGKRRDRTARTRERERSGGKGHGFGKRGGNRGREDDDSHGRRSGNWRREEGDSFGKRNENHEIEEEIDYDNYDDSNMYGDQEWGGQEPSFRGRGRGQFDDHRRRQDFDRPKRGRGNYDNRGRGRGGRFNNRNLEFDGPDFEQGDYDEEEWNYNEMNEGYSGPNDDAGNMDFPNRNKNFGRGRNQQRGFDGNNMEGLDNWHDGRNKGFNKYQGPNFDERFSDQGGGNRRQGFSRFGNEEPKHFRGGRGGRGKNRNNEHFQQGGRIHGGFNNENQWGMQENFDQEGNWRNDGDNWDNPNGGDNWNEHHGGDNWNEAHDGEGDWGGFSDNGPPRRGGGFRGKRGRGRGKEQWRSRGGPRGRRGIRGKH